MTDGIDIQGESGSSSLNPNIALEQRAVELGWKPKDDFKGNPEDWVDAKDYIAREPLLKEVRDLKKHIRTQREQTDRDMAVITAQFSQMSEMAYKKAVSELEAQRDLAIQDQDIQSVRVLDKKIAEAALDHDKQQQTTTRQQARQADVVNEEMDQWRAANKWFDEDQELQDEAVTIGVGFQAKNPKKTQAQMLTYVEDRIKKIYPDKFKPAQRAKVEDQDNRVESRSASPNLGKGKSKLSWGDLDDDERQVGKTLIKRGVLKDVAAKNKRSEQDEFLAQLSERKAK